MNPSSSIRWFAPTICGLLVTAAAQSQPAPPPGKQWVAVPDLTDEFNSWDSSKWWKPLWNYGEPVQMVAGNSGVTGGNLWIKATLDSGSARWFQTSRVMSHTQIRYPMYTECRMRTAHLSAYNTFWLNNGDSNNRDEIDICENNSNPSITSQTDRPYTMYSQYFIVVNGDVERAHGDFDNRNLSPGNPLRGVKWNEAYHTLGAWWKDENNVQFYLDGEPAGSVVTTRDFTRHQNIIWDLWTIDATWSGGLADQSDLLNTNINTMYVDWIHTFELVGIPATNVLVSPSAATLGVGQSVQLMATVFPTNAANPSVTWNSGNPAVASVNAAGLVSGMSAGTATVTVTTVDGGFTDSSLITVTNPPPGAADPVLASAHLEGGNIVMQVTNGMASGFFHLLSSPDVTTPTADWVTNQVGLQFDAGGVAWATNPVSDAREYFRVKACPECGAPPALIPAVFDWAEVAVGTAWWTGYGYTETDNSATMISGGRAASYGGMDGVGGEGFALKAAYSADASPGTFNMQVGGVNRSFVVRSIDISANNAGGQFTPTVKGQLGGVEQWSITPSATSQFVTYTAATAGDLGLFIDQIVWNTGVSSTPDTTFGNNIDNLSVEVAP